MVPIGELFILGFDLMKKADADLLINGTNRHNAIDYRDGLMIALLASRPLRQRNFVSIEIGKHLIKTRETYRLAFTASETKTNVALEITFPNHLLPMLMRYLTAFRPFLLALRKTRGESRREALNAADNGLWVTQYGTQFSASAQTKILKKHTVARFGKYVNPHLFRDCAASSIANEDPDHVRVSAQILGHTRFRTTETYYIQAEAGVATRSYHDQIMALRKNAVTTDRKVKRTGYRGQAKWRQEASE
jgi:site-specific recombinase XerD